MSDKFSTVEVNMAAEPEVLMTLLLQKIETSFHRQHGTTKLAYVCDIDWQRGTLLYAEYAQWRAITGSGDNLGICPNIVIVPNLNIMLKDYDYDYA